jgi:hypothetical protein
VVSHSLSRAKWICLRHCFWEFLSDGRPARPPGTTPNLPARAFPMELWQLRGNAGTGRETSSLLGSLQDFAADIGVGRRRSDARGSASTDTPTQRPARSVDYRDERRNRLGWPSFAGLSRAAYHPAYAVVITRLLASLPTAYYPSRISPR